MKESIRWGIMGPGGIAKQFTTELKLAPNAIVQAVGSRSLERASAFAQTFQIPNVHGSYEALVEDTEVDIIYVATPHPHHHESVMMCLRAGKAVLCEKPFTMNGREAKEIIAYAREQSIFLMEAMWNRYLPTMKKVRSWIREGQIGEVKTVKAEFGFKFNGDPEHRLLNKALGGGALLDAGIYPVSLASWVFGEQPQKIHSTVHMGSTHVDEWNSMLFDYGDGRTAALGSSVCLMRRNDASIFGTEGSIHIDSIPNSKVVVLTRHGHSEERYADTSDQMGYGFQAKEAMRCLREGLLESPEMPWDEMLANMQTLDRIRADWGLTYPSDK